MSSTIDEVQSVIDQLQVASAACVHPLLQSYAKRLDERAKRLIEQQYTVAFFGAFSAGKSSLINALIGEQVLPVSPNPTTAAINRVLPPTEEYPHGTILVVFKTLELVAQEVAISAAMLELPTSLEGLSESLNTLDVAQLQDHVKPHYSYLRGIARGYQAMEKNLGETLAIEASELRVMVATEEHAAFVSRVDMYHDSILARDGVVLVDTPGVDSLHARHTDVAFRYMRDADAIVFVTYYNHAFSQPDREFLMQLGRVKEALATDTMFFVINASDLRSSEEELETVKEHVTANLARLGVRTTRLFALSSQLGLAAKMMQETSPLATGIERMIRQRLHLSADAALPTAEQLGQSAGVTKLVDELKEFTSGRLVSVSMKAARIELAQVFESIKGYLEALEGDRATLLAQFEKQEQQAQQLSELFSQDIALDEVALEQELSELLYHVKQRIHFNHSELIVQAFHPANLTKGDAREVQLALQEWMRMLTLAVEQEVRATMIRIDRRARKLLEERLHRVGEVAKLPPLGYILQSDNIPSAPDELPPHPQFEVSTQVQKIARGEFRNAEQFFEQGGRKGLGEKLEPFGIAQVESYMQDVEHWFHALYNNWLHVSHASLLHSITEELSTFLAQKQQVLEDDQAQGSLQQTLASWPTISY
ncbi:MAG: dynamin family protein [Acidibacillus sp.]|uniref:GTPase Era n=1 Tax=Sulfoacidibacillus ferrooxidans TaxID=2005001 RepID=A0A9X1V7Q3_9BACL|nr:GTPase Era [Sulfoacidibacillus ferrooxidans]MCY0893292.1 dynamin family protein [Acidibacillus sp.]